MRRVIDQERHERIQAGNRLGPNKWIQMAERLDWIFHVFSKPRQEANRHAEGLKECRKMCETQKRSLELLGLKWLVLGLWMWLMWHVKTS